MLNESAIVAWIKNLEQLVNPLEIKLGQASWNLALTGKKEFEDEVAQHRLALRKIFSDHSKFSFISEAKKLGNELPALLKRQVDLIWRGFAENQIDLKVLTELTQVESQTEGIFSNYRGQIDGKKVNANEIKTILRDEKNERLRKKAWEASKSIGPEVAPNILKMVDLRNQGARSLGYDNFYAMSLALDELSETKLFQLLDQLEKDTQAAYAEEKQTMDTGLRERLGFGDGPLRPWHYADPFFQESPPLKTLNLDQFFNQQDVVELTRKTFSAMGLEIDGIVKNSDLFPREGKYQHAFCTMIGRTQDVRVLCNVENNEYWMSTMLHEFGHAVYDFYLDDKLPFFLFGAAHILSTEAIAMLFGRFTRRTVWLEKVRGLSPAQTEPLARAVAAQARQGMLIFVRWVSVMCHFERALYTNPGQDLNALWWSLVKRFQMVEIGESRSNADWASKIHIALSPVYYQNYLYGELLASQLEHHLEKNILKKPMINEKQAGEFLIEKYFKMGSTLRWDHLLEQATGEPLQTRYFTRQFVEK